MCILGPISYYVVSTCYMVQILHCVKKQRWYDQSGPIAQIGNIAQMGNVMPNYATWILKTLPNWATLTIFL